MARARSRRSPRRSITCSTPYPGPMADVFDRLVGQPQVVAALRGHARAPVHAYLFAGPAGAALGDAVVAFAAALQCPERGCGHCEACRLVPSGNDPDVTLVERAGLAW